MKASDAQFAEELVRTFDSLVKAVSIQYW